MNSQPFSAEKQTSPLSGKQDFHNQFQSNESQDSFGEPAPAPRGIAEMLQGHQLPACGICGKPLASYAGMDNHACAGPFEYNNDVKPNVTKDTGMKRN